MLTRSFNVPVEAREAREVESRAELLSRPGGPAYDAFWPRLTSDTGGGWGKKAMVALVLFLAIAWILSALNEQQLRRASAQSPASAGAMHKPGAVTGPRSQ